MSDIKDYKQLTTEFKKLLKSFNTDINTEFSGGYIDVISNAIGGVVSGAYSYSQMIEKGSDLFNANEFMLEQWLKDFDLPNRKTGTYATGKIEIDLKDGTSSLIVPKGTVFSFNIYNYETLVDYIVTPSDNIIQAQAVKVGAEYNLGSDVTLDVDIGDIDTAKTLGFGGGSGVETISQMQLRILTNLAYRKTDSQASDFTQYALNFFNFAVTSVLKSTEAEIIPIGANVTVANTINDVELASKNPNINQINASTPQLEGLKKKLDNFKNCTVQIKTTTLNTQVIEGIVVKFTADTTLSTGDKDKIIEKTRQSLLSFQGTYLYPQALVPDIDAMVSTYYIEDFAPIKKTSLYMDSITITADQYTL